MTSISSGNPKPFQPATAPLLSLRDQPAGRARLRRGALWALLAPMGPMPPSSLENLPPRTAPDHAALRPALHPWLVHAAPRRRAAVRRHVERTSRSARDSFFSSSAEGSFDAAAMYAEAELLFNQLRHLSGVQLGLGFERFFESIN